MVTIGPVHWGHPGETLERVMAVLVAQDHPDVLRRTPSSGDGGVDLMIPDDGGYEVQQIKGFTGRIGSSEKRQIKDSWDIFRTDPRLDKPIKAYRVVVPVDLTSDEQLWFEGLITDAPWPTSWRGKVHWDSLASRHPHVIDYMLGGGRETVVKRSRALQAAFVDPNNPLTALDIAARVDTLLSALNRDDPHYRYNLRTDSTPPPRSELQNCALAATQNLAGGGYITVLVVPKHRYALEDEPITGSLNIVVRDDDDPKFRAAFDAFQQFGRPLNLPEGSLSASLTAPGGLGGSFSGGGGWIGAPLAATADLPPLRLVVVDETSAVLGELRLNVPRTTSGPLGGIEIHVVDDPGVLTGSVQITAPDAAGKRGMQFTFSLGDLEGRHVLDVLATVRVLCQLKLGNSIEIRPQYGKKAVGKATIVEDQVPLTPGGWRHLEDLAVVQAYADGPVVVPAEIEPAFAQELHELVRMIQGETICGTWSEGSVGVRPGVSQADAIASMPGEPPLAMEQEMVVEVDGQQVNLGVFTRTINSAKVAPEQPDDEAIVNLVPGADPEFSQRFGPLQR